MLAFLGQLKERCRSYLLRAPPTKPASRSMNISKKFMNILELSFEARYLGEDVKLSKKQEKVKAIEDRMNVFLNYVQDVSSNPKFDDIVALAAAYYNIGLIYAKSTEICEQSIAAIHLSTSLKLLQENILDPKAIMTALSALNELDSIYQNTKTTDKHTLQFLPEALKLYVSYVYTGEDCPNPVHIASVVSFKEEESNPKIILETIFCRILYDLGIHYLAKPKDKHEFVRYLHNMLKVQLTNISEGKLEEEFEEKDIALTLFDLSKYFLANDRFTEAQKHITAADYVIQQFFPNKFPTVEDEKNETQCKINPSCENYGYIHAISDSSWGSYGVHLLRFWMGKFLENKANPSYEIQKLMLELEIEPKNSNLLIFSGLEKELECMMHKITETRILNPDDAKSVFVKTLRHLDRAKEYFSTDTDIESYAKIVFEISNSYKYFAGFEEKRNKQIKLHKRRVECLENVGKRVQESPTTTVNTELQIYKRISCEIVTSCSAIMDLMFEESFNENSVEETLIEVVQYAKLIEKNISFYSNIV